ncbi:MAG TPA: ABC transporter permease [Gammaproteobacteria bacterium]|nr:ABC transporter permease [Gammaproteobacteria bacterium]
MSAAGLNRIEEARRALRYAWRGLFKSPWFTGVAVLTLGLGIGVNTAIFSVIHSVLLAPLPYDDAGRLVLIRQSAPLAGQNDVGVSIRELYDYRERLASFDALVEFHQMDFDLLRRGDPDRVATGVVSHNFFDVLGIRPLYGRTFVEADDRAGAEAVLVLGNAYWKSRFGGDPNVIGQVFEMNDRPHTVVGVLPPVALYPNEVDVFMPTVACPFRAAGEQQMEANRRAFSLLRVFGKLKDGVLPETAAAEVTALGDDFAREFPSVYRPEAGFRAETLGVQEALTQNARPMLLVLLGITALVLLLACANVGNLMLARTLQRSHERATRAALGAGRLSLLAQPLAESVLVAIAGAAVALLFAWATLGLLATFIGRFTPRAGEIGIAWPVFAFTMGVALVAGVLLGVLPALGARVDVARAMKTGSKGGGTPRRLLQHALVAGQVTVSVVLLAAAGLLLLSVARLQSVDAGYRVEHVLSAEIFANFTKYATPESRHRLYQNVLEAIEAVPGVTSAAITNAVPLSGMRPGQTRLVIGGREDGGELAPTVDGRIASPNYFGTLGIPVLRGRVFDATDTETTERVAVINEAAARQWGDRDPFGARVAVDGGRNWYRIVGVVGNVRNFGLDVEAAAQAYTPLAQANGNLQGRIVARTAGDPGAAMAAIRSAIQNVDPDMPIERMQTLDTIRAAYLATPRLTALLLTIFAGLALCITVTGIAGVIATSIAQRTREIGLRIAVGASARGVLAMVLKQGFKLVGIGLGVGVPLAVLFGLALRSYLFATPPADPLMLAGVALALAGAGALGCAGPALRAARIDPITALRAE